MVAVAWIAGIIGGLCMAMGIVTATEAIPLLGSELTWLFWLVLSGILFLISIVFTLGRGVEY
jgi:uncharacterized membrane protein